MRGDLTLTGGRWSIGGAHFTSPVGVIEAKALGDVAHALTRVEAAAKDGNWVVGFVAYEAAAGLDPRLATNAPEHNLPLVWFGVYPGFVGRPGAQQDKMVESLAWQAAMSEGEHAAAVSSIRDAIGRGDTYQVNLTFPMRSVVRADSLDLFDLMMSSQPDCYGAVIDLGEVQVLSVSPELFLHVDGRSVVARPMKGTAPRGRWADEDELVGEKLASSEKERSGNLMIVDMVRNDLGRISEVGSVQVPELFGIERHPTLWQMTSTVLSTLHEDANLVDVFTACFPSGSVTGAPKPSTMGIIAEHETSPRGVYCGAIGYLEPGGGGMEFSVAIRTGVLRDSSFTYHVGGGITWDSAASIEYDECRWKALVVTKRHDPPDLLETMRCEPDVGIPLLDRHLDRLARSAGYWEIPFDSQAVHEALTAVETSQISRVRLILTSEGHVRIEVADLEGSEGAVPLAFSAIVVDPTDPGWFHKSVDRSRYPNPPEPIEEILFNVDGLVTETNRSSLLASIDGIWVTPPLQVGLLPGVARAVALEEGSVTEGILRMEDIRAADGLAVINAVRGWRTAHLIE